MNVVKVKGVELGSGLPKICIPLVGKTLTDLKNELDFLKQASYDIIEWRVDHYEDVLDYNEVLKACKLIKEMSSDAPLLFTFRTKKEGGVLEIPSSKYFELLHTTIESADIDMVDVELFMGDDDIKSIIECANGKGVKVVMCNHDFDKTPEADEIVGRLIRMQEMGADVCKIAVMPTCEQDVITLLQATLTMKKEHATCPIITMSMSKMGMVSRVSGSVFGSCMTFGLATTASAPGQIPSNKLREMLEIFG